MATGHPDHTETATVHVAWRQVTGVRQDALKLLTEYLQPPAAEAERAAVNATGRVMGRVPREELLTRLTFARKALNGELPPSITYFHPDLQRMLDSYSFDLDSRISRFIVPGSLYGPAAYETLTTYVQGQGVPDPNGCKGPSVAVDMESINKLTLPNFFPQEQDGTRDHTVIIHVGIRGTKDRPHAEQVEILRQKNLVFADPFEASLAGALHSLRLNGADLFRGSWARAARNCAMRKLSDGIWVGDSVNVVPAHSFEVLASPFSSQTT